jgi:hypothetical protein
MYLGQDGNVERMVGTVYSMDSNLVAPAPHPVVRNPRGLPSLSLI